MASGNRPLQFSTKQQAQREDLFERAKYGKITGDEADTEAIRLGLGSLSHGPDPDEFRPGLHIGQITRCGRFGTNIARNAGIGIGGAGALEQTEKCTKAGFWNSELFRP